MVLFTVCTSDSNPNIYLYICTKCIDGARFDYLFKLNKLYAYWVYGLVLNGLKIDICLITEFFSSKWCQILNYLYNVAK